MKSRLGRRSFLMMTGGSGAALLLKPGEKYIHKLIPYVNPPEYPKPGEWAYYSTTCRECPAGCGQLLWHRDGRVTKADGHPFHPINKGKLCIRGQSSVQGEYHPERLSRVLEKVHEGFDQRSWEDALSSIKHELAAGRKLLVISDLQTGSLAGVIKEFTASYNAPDPVFYEPLNYEAMRKANSETYGSDSIPRYNIRDCDLIISFGAGFLETWLSPVEYARDFSEFHSLKNGRIGKLIYLAPAETLTAVNADEFFKIEPSSETAIIYEIIGLLAENGRIDKELLAKYAPSYSYSPGKNQAVAENLAGQISRSNAPFILSGNAADTSVQGKETMKAVNLLNELLGSGNRLDFAQSHALGSTVFRADMEQLLEGIDDRYTVIIHNSNPVYTLPALAPGLKNAGSVIYIGHTHNETTAFADWILPCHFSLEDWGDYEPWKGTVSLIQPTMRPIYDTKSAGDIFLELMAGRSTGRTFKNVVHDNWKAWYNESTQTESTEGKDLKPGKDIFNELLQQGTILYNPGPSKASFAPAGYFQAAGKVSAPNEFYLYAYPSLFFYDGKLSNRSWLQEIPDPVSNIVWQSWIDINKGQASQLNIAEGDILRLSAGPVSLEAAARLSDKVSENTAALEIGQGHWDFGETANGTGINAYSLMTGGENIPVVTLQKIDRNEQLLYLSTGEEPENSEKAVYVDNNNEQYGRDLLKVVDLKELLNGKARREDITWPTPAGYDPERDLYKPHEHKKHRWGMVIDLQSCIGCKACEAACYAENNIAVVGKENCSKGREMSWLKIHSYKIKIDKSAFIPVPCQHCDAAPCEPVCPVFASVHNEEGLNAQIYNRCVGTRYCSNNCPYKVRRFNWSNVKHVYPMTMQLNPEVTVRERGVMEKCTFCIQRIRNTEDKAKIEDRPVEDGEIVTACQQTCPTNAIVFGDLNDENSRVRKLMDHERRYQLLRELNTKPAVVYLKKINIT